MSTHRHRHNSARAQAGHDPRRAGFTLIEFLLALAIIACLSAAVCTLLVGAFNTSRYLLSAGGTNSEVGLAIGRMLHNLRMCSALVSPTNNTAQNTFTIVTQPDANNGNATYTVSYTLSGTQLTETDTRYGSNVICNNVSAFTVQLMAGTTNVVQITLTEGSGTQVTRTFKVYCRNL